MTTATVPRLQREIPHDDPVRTTVARRKPRSLEAQSKLPPSRIGKVAINSWTTPERRSALKAYAALHDTSIDALMDEALANLFELHGIKVKSGR